MKISETITDIVKLLDLNDDDMMKLKKYISDKEDEDWEKKFYDMKDRYVSRFYTSEKEIKDDQFADIKSDTESTVKSVDELFKEKEGDYSAN